MSVTFIPTLGESQLDMLVDPIDKVEYLVAFSLINPGFTSETFEDVGLALFRGEAVEEPAVLQEEEVVEEPDLLQLESAALPLVAS